MGTKQKEKLLLDVPGLEEILNQSSSDTYSDNMDRLFAEDERNNFLAGSSTILSSNLPETPNLYEETPSTSPAKSVTYFTATAFWKNNGEFLKVGVVLSKLKSCQDLCFLMCNASKIILEKLCVDNVEFQFSEDDLAVRIMIKQDDKEVLQSNSVAHQKGIVKVKFVDRLTFLNFAITALLRCSKQSCFKLFDGSGEPQIDSSCDIRYNLIKHSFDDEGQMKLPDERRGVKTRLSVEKIRDHVVYKWLREGRKGSHFLIKDSESSILEVSVDKIRKTSDIDNVPQPEANEFLADSSPKSQVEEIRNGQETSPSSERDEFSEVLQDNPSISLLASEKPITPNPSAAPRLSVQVSPSSAILSTKTYRNPHPEHQNISKPPALEDVRDALHRIIGIELDRIEMRLNAKFEKLQQDINFRLDSQAVMLQQLLEKPSPS